MKEYIERSGLLCALVSNDYPWMHYADAYEIAKNAPIADVVERKRGEWLEGLVIQTDISALYDYTCSECGIVSSRESNFCPNCGADMRGEQHEAD